MELYLPNETITRNAKNGQFLKGHSPHNKGKKWSEYLDMRKAKRIKRIAMQNLKPNYNIGGSNKRQIVGIKDGKLIGSFESSESAGRYFDIIARNIRHCCQGKRKRCGGIQWFYESDYKMWSELVTE